MPYATLSEGNSKLGSIHSISLPPVLTCAKNLPCYKGCYARQQYRQYPGVRNSYNRNFRRWQNNPTRYFNSIIWQIKKKEIQRFRWHVGGDIPCPSYVKGMIQVAKEIPDCKFLVFTKQYDMVKGNFPKNMSVVLSVWPGLRMPKSKKPLAFMDDGSETRIRNAESCPGNCSNCFKCWNLSSLKKNMVFDFHSGPLASAKARKAKRLAEMAKA